MNGGGITETLTMNSSGITHILTMKSSGIADALTMNSFGSKYSQTQVLMLEQQALNLLSCLPTPLSL